MTAARPTVAVLGCGHWGRNLVRNFHALGALAAVCDDDPAAAAACADRFGVPALHVEMIMGDPSIEAVVIATPGETHAPLTLRAIEAGKHVFVEKPLALDVADGIRMGEAADAAGRILMVGHLLRYHPAFFALSHLVQEGNLGRLRHISSSRLSLGRIRREEDVFWSFAPHDISMILTLAGTMPESVLLRGVPCLHDRNPDIATAHLGFAGGLAAQISVSWLHPTKQQRLVVVGDAGMAVFDDLEPWARKLLLYPHKILWRNGRAEAFPAEPVPVPLEEAEPLSLECRHFLDCVTAGSRPRSDWREGLTVLRVLDAGRRSMGTGIAASPTPTASPDFFVHPSAVIDAGCRIGSGTKIWFFSHVLKGSQIGMRCIIGQNVMIGANVNVGNNCKIQNNVSIYTGVTLEDGVFCGPSCVFTNVNNPRAEIERKDEFRPTVVGRGATIGANATIVCGHRIGRYAFVAAGAVVTRDVPAHALVAGNPARRVGWMSEAGYRLGEDLVCPHTARRHGPDGNGGLQALPDIREVA
jgi:predicted dehydrogenase/acetyltransferase-like isoleucine patch superfamily enzyme